MHPFSLLVLSLGLPALACGPAGGTDEGSESPVSESSGAQTPQTTTGVNPGTTTSPEDSGTTAVSPGTSSSGAMETEQPPLFDLGEVPDMPKVPPPPIPDFDCDTAPMQATGMDYQQIVGARGYHGLAITPDGLAIGSDGSSYIESDYAGMWGLFLPGTGPGQQITWMADGDMAAYYGGNIMRVRLDATTEVLMPGYFAYGVVNGPDDMLYLTPNGGGAGVTRLDPLTGASELIVPSGGINLHSVGFSPDGQRMYVGTVANGTVYYVDFDGAMNPVGGLQVFATGVGNGSGWHDAVAVDLCGYVYVPDYYSRNLYRISPAGDVVLFWDPASPSYYAHGLAWGTGEHDWREDALYFPQPYNGNNVGEIVVGVPPRDWPANPINVPPSL